MNTPTFDQALADQICGRIAAGRSLRSICASPGMPTEVVVHQWRAAHPAFDKLYAAARQLQLDYLADRVADLLARQHGGEL